MTSEQKARLEAKTTVGLPVWFKVKGGAAPKYLIGRVADEVSVIVADYKHLLQRIAIAKPADWGDQAFGYRTGYYTFDARGTRLLWGQYTQFLTARDYRTLLARARAKGWDLSFDSPDDGTATMLDEGVQPK